MTSQQNCKTCCFYLNATPGLDVGGMCRRNPPVILSTTRRGIVGEYAAVESKYPQVSCDDWCGEYQPAVHP